MCLLPKKLGRGRRASPELSTRYSDKENREEGRGGAVVKK
jgi:hypothetical protein